MENKTFEFKREDQGVRLSKIHHGRSWYIVLTRDDYVWWISELVGLWRRHLVRSRRASGYILTLRLCKNSFGRFFTLEKLVVNGGSVGLRFPEGSNGAGWGSLVDVGKRVGPYVNYVGSQTSLAKSITEKYCCRKCGSSDIVKQ